MPYVRKKNARRAKERFLIVLNALLVDEIRKHPSGQVDLIGLYEDIYLDQVPSTLENIQLFMDLELAPADRGKRHQIEVRILHPVTKEIVGQPLTIRFEVPEAAQFARNTAQLDLSFFDITFPTLGQYTIEIHWAGEVQRRLPLYVYPRAKN
jgi:hypothetical protein